MRPNIGIAEEHLTQTCNILNALLADEFALYARTRYCHWNVTGPAFSVLHKFFEEQYEQLATMIDEVAERVRMLGGTAAAGNMGSIGASARLPEAKEEQGAMKMVLGLLNDHETIIREVRENLDTVNEAFKDAGTADFLTGVMEAHEKMAWMLRAHL
ncbi:Dps family protein [Nemorincola caseinilytica]|uniref:Dps family protein n=1 Tax=Nemorincola caseinilytica TaxID=2054315 RepID=A0ABP8NSS9_9BACT